MARDSAAASRPGASAAMISPDGRPCWTPSIASASTPCSAPHQRQARMIEACESTRTPSRSERIVVMPPPTAARAPRPSRRARSGWWEPAARRPAASTTITPSAAGRPDELGQAADRRRPDEEAQVAGARDRCQPDACGHAGHLARGAEDDRHDARHPGAQAREAGDRGHRRGGDEGEAEADGGDAAAGAHDGLGAEAVDQPVAEDRARAVIVTLKAVKPMAATPAVVPSSSRR